MAAGRPSWIRGGIKHKFVQWHWSVIMTTKFQISSWQSSNRETGYTNLGQRMTTDTRRRTVVIAIWKGQDVHNKWPMGQVPSVMQIWLSKIINWKYTADCVLIKNQCSRLQWLTDLLVFCSECGRVWYEWKYLYKIGGYRYSHATKKRTRWCNKNSKWVHDRQTKTIGLLIYPVTCKHMSHKVW